MKRSEREKLGFDVDVLVVFFFCLVCVFRFSGVFVWGFLLRLKSW